MLDGRWFRSQRCTRSIHQTEFLNNAATVFVMAPIAAGFAKKAGIQPDAFLMAVAIGAGCDV